MMPTYHVAALDHYGNELITVDHTSPRPLECVLVHTSWAIGTIAITGSCGCVLAVIACPTGHPSRKAPSIHVNLEHT